MILGGFIQHFVGFPAGSVVENLLANAGDAGDPGSIPGSERPPGGGNGNPLQDSCLENPVDRGAWWATVPGVAKTWPRLSTHAYLQSINAFSSTLSFHIPSGRLGRNGTLPCYRRGNYGLGKATDQAAVLPKQDSLLSSTTGESHFCTFGLEKRAMKLCLHSAISRVIYEGLLLF